MEFNNIKMSKVKKKKELIAFKHFYKCIKYRVIVFSKQNQLTSMVYYFYSKM